MGYRPRKARTADKHPSAKAYVVAADRPPVRALRVTGADGTTNVVTWHFGGAVQPPMVAPQCLQIAGDPPSDLVDARADWIMVSYPSHPEEGETWAVVADGEPVRDTDGRAVPPAVGQCLT